MVWCTNQVCFPFEQEKIKAGNYTLISAHISSPVHLCEYSVCIVCVRMSFKATAIWAKQTENTHNLSQMGLFHWTGIHMHARSSPNNIKKPHHIWLGVYDTCTQRCIFSGAHIKLVDTNSIAHTHDVNDCRFVCLYLMYDVYLGAVCS